MAAAQRSLTDQRRVLTIDCDTMAPFEVGALLQAILMYPQRRDEDKFHEAQLALCAAFAAEQVRSVPDYAACLRKYRPQYFTVEPKVYRATRKAAVFRFRHRALAALMARPFVGRGLSGEAYRSPLGDDKLTPTAVAAYVAAYHKDTPIENLLERAWRPSLPILPLAIGFDSALLQRKPARSPAQNVNEQIAAQDFAYDLQDVDLAREAVRLSVGAEEIVRSDPAIRIADNELISIVWHE